MSKPRLLVVSSDYMLRTITNLVKSTVDYSADDDDLISSEDLLGSLSKRLHSYSPDQVRETIVIIDLMSESSAAWDVWNNNQRAGQITTLILTFPEVYFIFCNCQFPILPKCFEFPEVAGWDALKKLIVDHHFIRTTELSRLRSLLQIHLHGFRTMFDPTGLRSYLKRRFFGMHATKRRNVYSDIVASRLVGSVVTADDEMSFLFLHAYTAYRAGFRVWLAQSELEYKWLLYEQKRGESKRPVECPERSDCVLTDWDLQFSDLSTIGDKVGDLVRGICADRLTASNDRNAIVIVTSFHIPEEERPKKSCTVLKPYAGMHFLLESGDSHCAPTPLNYAEQMHVRQHYKKFWNELKEGLDQKASGSNRHSAVFPQQRLVNHITSRVGKLKTCSQHDLLMQIQSALLAMESKEILGGLSLTLSYETLYDQHIAEVNVEVQFPGIAMELCVRDRLNRLESEVLLLAETGKEGKLNTAKEKSLEAKEAEEFLRRESLSLSFLLKLSNALRRIFADNEQFMAAEETAVYFAKYIRRLRAVNDRLAPSRGTVRIIKCFFRRWKEDTVIQRQGSQESDSKASGRESGWFVRKSHMFVRSFLSVLGGTFQESTVPSNSRFVCCVRCIKRFPTWYLDAATRAGTSVGRLFLVSGVWIVLFAIAYAFLHLELVENYVVASVLDYPSVRALLFSTLTFLELQPATAIPKEFNASVAYYLILSVELIIAYLHLGILISVLYRKITKHAP